MDLGIFEIELYPYGNAHEEKLPNGTYQFHCQHGEKECIGNLIEACILDITNYNSAYYFPILECMESADDPVKAAPKCLEIYISDLPFNLIDKCAKVRNLHDIYLLEWHLKELCETKFF